jgi:protein MAK11
VALKARYSYEAHVGSVTCVAVSGDTLVSGGTDEMIKVYDLKKGVEFGTLMEHKGTITCLEFFGSTHLLSGSEDGAVMVWDAKTWDCLKVLHGHKAPVDAISA